MTEHKEEAPEKEEEDGILDIGAGVPRKSEPKPEEEEKKLKKDPFSGLWQDTPSLVDQLERYPDSVKPASFHACQFRLDDPTQQAEYESLVFQASVDKSIEMIRNEIVFVKRQGFFLALFCYHKLKFKKLAPAGKTLTTDVDD